MSLWQRFRDGLARTRGQIGQQVGALLGARDHALGRRRPDVGEQQRVLEALARCRVHRPAAAERRGEAAGERVTRAREPGAETAPGIRRGQDVAAASSAGSARGARREASSPSKRTETSFEMPSSCIVTP